MKITNKEQMKGIVQGAIGAFEYGCGKFESLAFDVYEVNSKWLIGLHYPIIDVPSSEANPVLDNSVYELGRMEFRYDENQPFSDLHKWLADSLESITRIKVITERSKL